MDYEHDADEENTEIAVPADKSSHSIPISRSSADGSIIDRSKPDGLSSGKSSTEFTGNYSVTPITEGFTELQVQPISESILEICSNLYFRQSMIKDYLTCPQLMLYKWIIGHEEEDSFFAALLGTAGHSVIEAMHQQKNVKYFNYTSIDLATLFIDYAELALKSSSVPPRVSSKFSTISAQLNAVAPEYVQMLQGYAHDERNQKFYATVCEQLFALCIQSSDPSHNVGGKPGTYIFTGTIDQAGFYDDGSFALRDIKFRANNFKPAKTQLQLDMQLSLYAYALMYGKPACEECKPRYTCEAQLLYTGPCEDCQKKIGTALWPEMVAERTELIWMRDYQKHKKDEYAKHVTHPTEKELNPETRRYRKKVTMNEKWYHGYKAGDPCGPAIMKTERPLAFLNVQMADLIRICQKIKQAHFYRNAGDHCNFWCKFRQPCLDMLETEVQEIDLSTLNDRVATLDPFQDS